MNGTHQLQPEHKWLYFLISLAVMVNFSGLFIPLMDPDAGIYASISKNMILGDNYLELFFQGHDWLDKPHFPFWITAAFFKVWGIHTWSYKLPGILFVMLGAYYTYLFAKQYYNKTVALWSVFILLTAEHIIISNNDVRAEPYLTGLIIAAIYHFSNTTVKKSGWHLMAACFFTACAIMTKGLYTIIPVGGAIAGELIIKRNWKELFNPRWLIAGIMILVFITPELYSLWYQFDSHPEKVVYGKTGVSGIRFFLWDSQFDRFTSAGAFKARGNPFFFLHTLVWAFLPWSLVMYASIADKIRILFRKNYISSTEWAMVCGSIITVLIFSLSKFQLPYYTNIIFPLLAILAAQFICKLKVNNSAFIRISQTAIAVILLAAVILLQVFYSPDLSSFILLLPMAFVLVILAGLHFWLKADCNRIAFCRAGLAVIVFNLYLNFLFYPDLMKYQSGNEAAQFINKNYKNTPGVYIGIYAPAFEFYLEDSLIHAGSGIIAGDNPAGRGIWYITEEELTVMKQNGVRFEIIKELPDFHITMLKLKFINKQTRSGELKKRFLIKML